MSRRVILSTTAIAWLAAFFFAGFAAVHHNLTPVEDLLKLKEDVFKGIPKQLDAKSQYEWASWTAPPVALPSGKLSRPISKIGESTQPHVCWFSQPAIGRVYQEGKEFESAFGS